MCGIVGTATAAGNTSAAVARAMRDTLRHRGPDDEGLWQEGDGTVVLGHRRLSIIDLAGGHQPMADRSGDYRVVFNGEIYNFQALREELSLLGSTFHSSCDTEVIVEAYRAWGADCVERLNGMFAFAIYDARLRRIFAARDRAGEKPFFYRHSGGRLTFGSELKALMAEPGCPRIVDANALDAYLAFGYVPGAACILEGVRKLPQGHALVYDIADDKLRTWAYWTLPASQADNRADPEELVERLDGALLESVRLRLMADVPIGIMLSGGVDSSLITAMAARVAGRVKTYTVAFPGHGVYDESPYARMVAEHFGTDHTVVDAEPATVDLLPDLARQFDEPLADSSMVPMYIVSRLIRREATVALGGDGADELFGGYPHHSWAQSQARMRALIPAAIRRSLGSRAAPLLPMGLRGRNFLLGLTGDDAVAAAQFNQFFDPLTRRRLLRPLLGLGNEDDGAGKPEQFKAALAPAHATVLQQTTAIDFRSYLVDDILTKVDRASMLVSLEVRAPWLDPAVIDLAFARVPDRLRATARERKILPRKLAARLLPPGLDLKRKQGFSLPLGAWFKGSWGDLFRDVLTGTEQVVFDRGVINELLAGQQRGRSNTQRLFALTMFELWRRQYQVSVA